MRRLRYSLLGSVILLTAMGTAVAHAGNRANGHAGSRPALTKTLNIKEVNNQYTFVGGTVKVKVGTRVIWKNGTDALHTVTSVKSGLFNKNVASGKTTSIVFKKLGAFPYYCTIHPYMKGTITVVTH
jgi:plastocyanin